MLREFLENEALTNACLDYHKNPRSIMFYTSPYLRARQTCNDIISGIQGLEDVSYKIHEEPRMREQDFGNFQSTAEEMEMIWQERAHYGHFFYRIPHGESAADVYDRVASFNETLFRQFQHENFPNILILVTHGIWARVFLMKWFRWSYEEFESLRNIPHCQYQIMKRDVASGKFHLKTHLKTWDDLPEDGIDEEEVKKEFSDELRFNSKNKLDNLNDLDIDSIIRAQKDAIKSSRSKDKQLKEAFNKAMLRNSVSPQAIRSLRFDHVRYSADNQSLDNSSDNLIND